VEKRYPGNNKRHPVRPIVRPNAVEKLMKKKGSLSQRPSLPGARRWAPGERP
jgi:mitogen-activated protein kinase kinase kinase 13